MENLALILSQSLWNRAVSYDEKGMIAFELMKSQSLWNRAVSYDKTIRFYLLQIKSLNPFGTGQCLTTEGEFGVQLRHVASQSLWNRAVSYDESSADVISTLAGSQSLWNRAVSYDA